MLVLRWLFNAIYSIVALLFGLAAAALIFIAVSQLWTEGRISEDAVIEGIGLLAIALVGLEIAQTVIEEQVVRDVHPSGPTRARRFLSRFLVVVVVALAIETLVAVFKFMGHEPSDLPYAAAIGISAAAILAAWGVFIRLNTAAEELEPEAMAEAKREDDKVR